MNKMVPGASLIVRGMLVLCMMGGMAGGVARAQTLDEVLGVGSNDFKTSQPETLKLWDNLVSALEQNKFDEGEQYAQQFVRVTDFVEPYQKTFANLVVMICGYYNRLPPELKDQQKRREAEAEKSALGKVLSSVSSAVSSKPYRAETLDLITQLIAIGQYRPAFAAANVYLKKIDETDDKIVAYAQQAVDQQKVKAKAQAIAAAALKTVTENLNDKKLWGAQAEFKKAQDTIQLRVTDTQLLEMVKIEMTKTENEIAGRQAAAEKKREALFELARRDAGKVGKALDEFMQQYPDYPNYEEDKIKINDLRSDQVEKKFAARLAAIEEVIKNDPQEAKEMIKKLLESDANADDLSILKSKITALRRTILDKELVKVQARMDEAQGYLEKFSTDYAETIKAGQKPTLSVIRKITSGTENLVRARSLQAGAVKQLEILMQEPELDTVSKAKLVGLLESQKAAIAQMDADLASKSNILIALGVGAALVVVLIVVLVVVSRRRSPALLPAGP